MVGAVLQARQKYGIKTRIAHAHLAYVNNPSFVKRMYNSVLKVELRRYATDFLLAVRTQAGIFSVTKFLKKAISEFCRMRLIQKATPTIRAQEKE